MLMPILIFIILFLVISSIYLFTTVSDLKEELYDLRSEFYQTKYYLGLKTDGIDPMRGELSLLQKDLRALAQFLSIKRVNKPPQMIYIKDKNVTK